MSVALALAFLALAAGGGALATVPFVRRLSPLLRLAIGTPLGIAVQGLAGLPVAHAFGPGPAAGVAAAVSAAPLGLLCVARWRDRLHREIRLVRRRPLRPAAVAGVLAALALIAAVFHAACQTDPDGALRTLNPANLGDLPFHVAIVRGFVDGANYPPEHPEFAGARLTYPYLIDFVAALWVHAGVQLSDAFLVQGVALTASLAVLLHALTRRLAGGSAAAWWGLPIFFLSGGWGFTGFFADAALGGALATLAHLPRFYTLDDTTYRWGTVFNVLLGTQRSLVLGLPTGAAVWLLWRLGRRQAGAMWLSGLMTGFLPLGHIHTFLVLAMTGGARAAASGLLRRWVPWALGAALVAAPLLGTMLLGSQTRTGDFLAWQPGWDSRATGLLAPLAWAGFWLRNTGVEIPLALAGLRAAPRARTLAAVAFAVGFVLPNLVRLAPWVWDNLKMLVWAHLVASALCGAALAALARRGRGGVALAVGLCLLQVLAGGLDVTRVLTGAAPQVIFTADDRAFARAIVSATPPDARILGAPTYAHPVYLSGRRFVCGYGGHLWSHGLDYAAREEAVRRILGGAPDADVLLRRLEVDYIAVGPRERDEPGLVLDDAYLARFPVVAEAGGAVLRQVR